MNAVTVDTEPKTIKLQVDADPRFAAAVGGVARYVADSAGMENDAIAQLQAAVVTACNDAFQLLTPDHPHLTVEISKLSDRLEVVLSCECGSSPGQGKTSLGGVDRVQHEKQGNIGIIRLTKFINQGAPSR
ncbi:MAG TPA: hypothetical protein VGJ06_05705 [Candidatus Acidoferrum sp.]|jgi:hypothetical protein